ncbi:DinB family protein [Paenibacillus sp. HN-1]|uniref:DinB family protein n=1 Tax=Paenibacillus TaxID=44249 RepID=UPI001CA957DC|nr:MULTISPECIES: DinB family protein [Paenibacillus]MBY9079657.1 DinB family protein [Paenibacillus sp. CGMCC 1.18879]MBY9082908.1 DinB family protein [Paenibacillus sinensis]
MEVMFRYNWMVREQWYRWCEEVAEAELLRRRTGGVGSILQTLFHVVDVEWSWVRVLQGKPDFQESFDGYSTLEKVRQLDREFRPEVESFVYAWNGSLESRPFHDPQPDGTVAVDTWGEVMRHMIAHQIHHMGQLSVWAREIGKNPVSANVIGKGLISPQL